MPAAVIFLMNDAIFHVIFLERKFFFVCLQNFILFKASFASRNTNRIIRNMPRTEKEIEHCTLLGAAGVKYPTDYAPGMLETFPNKHPENEYLITFTCPEFTSLCPKTGQPDFGRIIINYIPGAEMVESKSLKLYLFSFRNHGDFHEDCINIIMKDLVKLMNPRYLEVRGIFMPRGGISIIPFANWGDEDHQDLVKARLAASFPSDF